MPSDPDAILGVSRDATAETIKLAYRKLARRHHPDLNPGNPEAEACFKAVSGANDLLSDPERRLRFDRGEIDGEGQEQRPAGGYRRHAEAEQGERYAHAPDAGVFEAVFADLFAAQRRADAMPRPGPDNSYRLAVPFLAAVSGMTERLTLPDGRTLDVKIPPGIASGEVMRLRGQGGAGRNSGPAGDALITINVADNAVF